MCLKKPQSKFVNCNEEATYILIPENGTLNVKIPLHHVRRAVTKTKILNISLIMWYSEVWIYRITLATDSNG
jgi:hypothetical protein